MDTAAELPPPLRGNENGTFTHQSVAVRLPEIASRILSENDLTAPAAAAVAALRAEIGEGAITPLDGSGPDAAAWEGYVAPHVGSGWLDVPWFFAEYYFYRRVLNGIRYWDTGADPYREQKELGLDQAIAPARQTIARVDTGYAAWVPAVTLLFELTDAALWGNQVDLSLWPTAAGEEVVASVDPERLIVDERAAAWAVLADRIPPPVDIVLDNAGAELLADLLVADMLLRSELAATVRLHVKQYPIFVSDATEEDVTVTLARMAADGDKHLRSAGERLRGEMTTGRLELVTSPFWVSPRGWRGRPEDLEALLAASGLIIVKGDANYRRLVDDRHWDYTTPFSAAIGATPAPLLALRTLKSEVAAGLPAGSAESIAELDPEWMQIGRWALAAFAPGPMVGRSS